MNHCHFKKVPQGNQYIHAGPGNTNFSKPMKQFLVVTTTRVSNSGPPSATTRGKKAPLAIGRFPNPLQKRQSRNPCAVLKIPNPIAENALSSLSPGKTAKKKRQEVKLPASSGLQDFGFQPRLLTDGDA
jgi:hypothetical protein